MGWMVVTTPYTIPGKMNIWRHLLNCDWRVYVFDSPGCFH